MQLTALILDFDGTIADTNACILATFNASFEALGLPVPAAEAITPLIGLPLGEMFERLTGSKEPCFIQQCIDMYHLLFPNTSKESVRLFDGVGETLHALKQRGLAIAIATSRGRDSLDLLLHRLGIGELFDMMVCLEDVSNKKPAPDMVISILHHLHKAADEALVVGDTVFDIEMGKRAGCLTCGVTYGNQTRQQLQQQAPDFIVDAFPMLLQLPPFAAPIA